MQKILNKLKSNDGSAIFIMIVALIIFTFLMADFLFTMFIRVFAPMDGI